MDWVSGQPPRSSQSMTFLSSSTGAGRFTGTARDSTARPPSKSSLRLTVPVEAPLSKRDIGRIITLPTRPAPECRTM